MALGAVCEIENILFGVFCAHFWFLVRGVTAIAGVFRVHANVACGACTGLSGFVIQWECMFLELRRCPRFGLVTAFAGCAELPCVHARFGMASDALGWGALEHLIDVAIGAW